MVGLTADAIELIADGRRIPAGNRVEGRNDPGSQDHRTAELEWFADGREQRLYLYFDADATDWWVSEARIYDNQQPDPDWITFPGPLFRTPIGEAFHGEIALTSDHGRVGGEIRMSGATIDPDGLGTGPRSWEGCTLWRDRGPAVSEVSMEGGSIARVSELVETQNLCVIYRWTYPVGPDQLFGETWCSPPPSGRVRFMRADDQGALLVFVDDDTVVRTPRRQPATGWGCDGAVAPSTAPSSIQPSPSPASTTAYEWSGAGATLTATTIEMTAADEIRVPANLEPTRIRIAPGVVDLLWEWRTRGPNRLWIRVETDGERWSVPEVAYQDRFHDDRLRHFEDVPMSGAVGSPWTGDLRLSTTVEPYAPVRIRLDDLVFDPGITPADLVAASPAPPASRPFTIDNGSVRLTADALEVSYRGETVHGPRYAGTVTFSTPARGRDQLDSRWTDDRTNVSLDLAFRTDGERWWVTDGSVWVSGWGQGRIDGGELTAPMGSPYLGDLDVVLPWGEEGQTDEPMRLVIRDLTLEPFRSSVPESFRSSAPEPSTSPTLGPAIDWDTGAVRMTADAPRIRAGGRVFTADVPDIRVGGDPGGTSRRTLEVEWQEQDREQRLSLYLAADDVSWWVTEVRVRDGLPNAEWITFAPPAFRVPLGGTWVGDLRLSDPAGSLEVDGMTLRAFSPDTLPAELRFCRPAIDPGTGDGVDPLADGQPLARTGIERMAPAAAKGLLTGMGLCHTFRYQYEYTDAPGSGHAEIWCDPPPGEIWMLRYGSEGEVVVFVADASPQQHSPRPQPPLGWGC